MPRLDRIVLLITGVAFCAVFTALAVVIVWGITYLFPAVRGSGLIMFFLAVLAFVVFLPGLVIGNAFIRTAFATRKELDQLAHGRRSRLTGPAGDGQ